jgi:hypothetical protein
MLIETISFKNVWRETFNAFSYFKKESKDSFDHFLYKELKNSSSFEHDEQIFETIKEINSTLEKINYNYDEILTYKAKGLPTTRWIEDRIDALQKKYVLNNPEDNIPKAIVSSLTRQHGMLYDEVFHFSGVSQVDQLVSYRFEDLNRSAVSNKLYQTLAENSHWSLLFGNYEDSSSESEKLIELIQPLKEFVESPLGDSLDDEVKKVAVLSVLKARHKGVELPFGNLSTSEISVSVDQALTFAKMAYKVATGEINIPDAINGLIDRTVATVEVIVSKNCEQVGGFIGEKVGQTIGSMLGPAGKIAVGFLGRVVGESVGKTAGDLINKGVKKLGDKAKDFIHKTYQGARVFVESGISKVKNIFGF